MNSTPQLTLTVRTDSEGYDHIDIDLPEVRVGSVRYRTKGDHAIIYSIQIFPEFQGNGYGRFTVDYFKRHYKVLIADRVRYTARDFWEKMDFVQEPNDEHYEHQWSWAAR